MYPTSGTVCREVQKCSSSLGWWQSWSEHATISKHLRCCEHIFVSLLQFLAHECYSLSKARSKLYHFLLLVDVSHVLVYMYYMCVPCELVLSCSNSKETTQLTRKPTWEKGPTTKPRTRDLRSNTEFQPRELRNQPHSLIPHRRLCASHGCAESTTT